LHRPCGFREVGFRESIGQMSGVWRDVILTEHRSRVAGKSLIHLRQSYKEYECEVLLLKQRIIQILDMRWVATMVSARYRLPASV